MCCSINHFFLLCSFDRCWDFIDDDLWWIIKTPTLITILVSDFTAACHKYGRWCMKYFKTEPNLLLLVF